VFGKFSIQISAREPNILIVFHDVLQSLCANAATAPQNRPCLLPAMFHPIDIIHSSTYHSVPYPALSEQETLCE
jgi:hypothetical protein